MDVAVGAQRWPSAYLLTRTDRASIGVEHCPGSGYAERIDSLVYRIRRSSSAVGEGIGYVSRERVDSSVMFCSGLDVEFSGVRHSHRAIGRQVGNLRAIILSIWQISLINKSLSCHSGTNLSTQSTLQIVRKDIYKTDISLFCQKVGNIPVRLDSQLTVHMDSA